MIDTERKEDLFLDTKLIKSENRLGKLRIIDELHPVLGGQPTHGADQPNDNNPLLDLACTMQFTIDKVNAVDKKADTKLAKAQNLKDVANVAIARDNLGLGTSSTMNATSTLSDRTDQTATIKVVNDVNRDVVTAQKTANNAHALAQTKQDKLGFIGNGEVIKEGGGNFLAYATPSFNAKNNKTSFVYYYPNADNHPTQEEQYFYGVRIGVREDTALELLSELDYRKLYFRHIRKERDELYEIYTDANTTKDKNGFLRTGNKQTMTTDQIVQKIGTSENSVMSQKATTDYINSVESKLDSDITNRSAYIGDEQWTVWFQNTNFVGLSAIDATNIIPSNSVVTRTERDGTKQRAGYRRIIRTGA